MSPMAFPKEPAPTLEEDSSSDYHSVSELSRQNEEMGLNGGTICVMQSIEDDDLDPTSYNGRHVSVSESSGSYNDLHHDDDEDDDDFDLCDYFYPFGDPYLRGRLQRKRRAGTVNQTNPRASKRARVGDSDYYDDLALQNDDDANSTSSDWDRFGTVPLCLPDWHAQLDQVDNSSLWNAEQQKLHKLIYMLGRHPVLPSSWRISFRMYGVSQGDEALQNDEDFVVFAPKRSKKRVAVRAYDNELSAATKALERLFILSQTVTDYEEIGTTELIPRVIVRTIRRYLKWAMRDAGIDYRRSLPNVLIRAYSPSDFPPDSSNSKSNGNGPSNPPVESSAQKKAKALKQTQRHRRRGWVYEDEIEHEDQDGSMQQFVHHLTTDTSRRLQDLGRRWRELLDSHNAPSNGQNGTSKQDKGRSGQAIQLPTLYMFVVTEHLVMLNSYDPNSESNPVITISHVALNTRRQWAWNALWIAVVVNLAREGLLKLMNAGLVAPLTKSPNQLDPDI